MEVNRIKKQSSKFESKLIASDGENYYVHCRHHVFRDKGKRMEKVASKNWDDGPNSELSCAKLRMTFADGALWACGSKIQVSVDRGENWNVVDNLDKLVALGIAATLDGIYVCGEGYKTGLVGFRPNGGEFTVIYEHPCPITAIGGTQHGVLLGDIEGGVWFSDGDSFKKRCQIELKEPGYGPNSTYPVFRDAIETREGTILLVGVQGIHRSTDGGKTFEPSSAPTSNIYSSIQQLPSGELVATGMIIAVSTNDGLDFEGLFEFESVGYPGPKDSCVHGESVLIASPADGVFSVSPNEVGCD